MNAKQCLFLKFSVLTLTQIKKSPTLAVPMTYDDIFRFSRLLAREMIEMSVSPQLERTTQTVGPPEFSSSAW